MTTHTAHLGPNELATLHKARMHQHLLAGSGKPGEVPRWLRESAERLAQRYDAFNTTREFQSILQSFREVEHKPFEIFVVGEGKFGKSTLLNALLGQQLSRVNLLPATRSFLRFVPAKDPSAEARVFARLDPGTHDWLAEHLGAGRPAPELFEMQEYRVPVGTADLVLTMENERCKQKGYRPAICEIEKQVPIARQACFPPNVRVVDTQGLNQLFPDELNDIADRLDAETTVQRFDQWMSTTARGKHLEWQLRRCDAVLWAVHARKPSSAVTRAAMRYFGQYGKSIILAVTNIDALAGDPKGRSLVMDTIRETCGAYVARICPLNAKQALASVLSDDDGGIEESGLGGLVAELRNTVLATGTNVRSAGLYNGLRTTETQLRRALRVLRDEFDANIRLHRQHTELAAATHKQQASVVLQGLSASADRCFADLRANVGSITLSDDARGVASKLNASAIGSRHQTVAGQLVDSAREHAEAVAQRIRREPYRLPVFDADGKRAGDSISAEVRAQVPAGGLPRLHITVHVPSDFWDGLGRAVWGFLGIFSAAAREKARRMEQEDTWAKQRVISAEVERQWRAYAATLEKDVRPRLDTLFAEIIRGLEDVGRRLETQEGRPMTSSREQLDHLLGGLAVEPAVMSTLVRALRRVDIQRCFSLVSASERNPNSRQPLSA